MAYYRSYRKKLNWRKVKYEDGISGVVRKPTSNGGCFGKDKSYADGDSGIYTLQDTHDEAFKTGGGGGGESADPGGVVFTTTGTHSWTCPTGVTSICVVCVGGGGGGHQFTYNSRGAGGGGLAFLLIIII